MFVIKPRKEVAPVGSRLGMLTFNIQAGSEDRPFSFIEAVRVALGVILESQSVPWLLNPEKEWISSSVGVLRG